MTLTIYENSLDKSKLFVARARQGIIPILDAKSMEGREVTLIRLLTILVLAISLVSCSHKQEDFETAKNAVAQELRSPDTARFCTLDDAEFSTRDSVRAVKLWVDNRNLGGVLVRTHFEVTIDPKSGLVKGATCLECAAEDDKQKLNEAVAELQGLTPPPSKASITPVPR